MEILNSEWLIKMLKKSSKSPQGRLLSLFDTLEDWLSAPNLIEKIREDSKLKPVPQIISSTLEYFLIEQATLAGAKEPAVLAHQLYFMLLGAIQGVLYTHNAESFTHAKSAAQALITAQTKHEFHLKKSSLYKVAASFFGASVILGVAFMLNGSTFNFIANNRLTNKSVKEIVPLQRVVMPQTTSQIIASPEQTASLFATLEQMRKGNCQFPEALQLPDSYKTVYIDNIIGGNISNKVADQKIIVQILQKVRCNYNPMLMENSTS